MLVIKNKNNANNNDHYTDNDDNCSGRAEPPPAHFEPGIEFSLEFGSNSMVFSVDSVRILAFF